MGTDEPHRCKNKNELSTIVFTMFVKNAIYIADNKTNINLYCKEANENNITPNDNSSI